MAKEPFFKINFRKSASKTDAAWEVYTKTYGAWMANAFQNQKKAKEQFISALDSLHKNYPKAAVQILDSELKPLCKTAEEKTAWLFFMGIAYESMEQYAKAFLYFTAASEYETESPVIYHKLADCSYREKLFGFAECNYREAIRLYNQENTENTASRRTLTELYVSLASCLTMMHEYQAAEEALSYSENAENKISETQKVRALLYAVQGEYEKAESSLNIFLQQTGAQNDPDIRQQIDTIRLGTHEQFSTIPVENSDIKAFWRWFSSKMDSYLAIMDTDQTEEISEMTSEISSRLKKVFPFIQHTIAVSAYKNKSYSIFVSDFYAQALSDGLQTLFEAMPEKIKEKIHWIKIH